jgi:hypothetical protein
VAQLKWMWWLSGRGFGGSIDGDMVAQLFGDMNIEAQLVEDVGAQMKGMWLLI